MGLAVCDAPHEVSTGVCARACACDLGLPRLTGHTRKVRVRACVCVCVQVQPWSCSVNGTGTYIAPLSSHPSPPPRELLPQSASLTPRHPFWYCLCRGFFVKTLFFLTLSWHFRTFGCTDYPQRPAHRIFIHFYFGFHTLAYSITLAVASCSQYPLENIQTNKPKQKSCNFPLSSSYTASLLPYIRTELESSIFTVSIFSLPLEYTSVRPGQNCSFQCFRW